MPWLWEILYRQNKHQAIVPRWQRSLATSWESSMTTHISATRRSEREGSQDSDFSFFGSQYPAVRKTPSTKSSRTSRRGTVQLPNFQTKLYLKYFGAVSNNEPNSTLGSPCPKHGDERRRMLSRLLGGRASHRKCTKRLGSGCRMYIGSWNWLANGQNVTIEDYSGNWTFEGTPGIRVIQLISSKGGTVTPDGLFLQAPSPGNQTLMYVTWCRISGVPMKIPRTFCLSTKHLMHRRRKGWTTRRESALLGEKRWIWFWRISEKDMSFAESDGWGSRRRTRCTKRQHDQQSSRFVRSSPRYYGRPPERQMFDHRGHLAPLAWSSSWLCPFEEASVAARRPFSDELNGADSKGLMSRWNSPVGFFDSWAACMYNKIPKVPLEINMN